MLDDNLRVTFACDRLGKSTVAIEGEEGDIENIMLPAYLPVFGRVNVEPTERDLITQIHRNPFLEQFLV